MSGQNLKSYDQLLAENTEALKVGSKDRFMKAVGDFLDENAFSADLLEISG